MHLALVVVVEGERAAFRRDGLGEVGAAARGAEGHDGRGKVVRSVKGRGTRREMMRGLV